MRKTPPSVIVLSILGIIWGLFCLGYNFYAVNTLLTLSNNPTDPVKTSLHNNIIYMGTMYFVVIVNFILIALLFFGSIGSFTLAPKARQALLLWAWGDIAATFLGFIAHFIFVIPQYYASTGGSASPYANKLLLIYLVLMFLWLLVVMALPVSILFIFSRTKITNAFNGIFLPTPSNFPVILDQPTP